MTLCRIPSPRRLVGAIAVLGVLAAASASAQSKPRCDFAGRSIPLSPGQKRDGAIVGSECEGKGDWASTPRGHTGALYRITLPATAALELGVTSAEFPPEVELVDAAGANLASDETGWVIKDSGRRPTTASIPVTLKTGTYYVLVRQGEIRPWAKQASGNRFEIRLQQRVANVAADAGGLCEEDEDEVRDAARRPPLSARGETRAMEFGVTDCFAFNEYRHHLRLSVPTRRTLVLRAEPLSEDLDPEVRLVDAAGVGLLGREDADSSDAGIRAEVPAGEYVVQVTDDGLGSWVTGKYRLHLELVGTPSADSSKAGAVCASRPDPVDVTRDTIWLHGVFTRASCTRAGSEAYHRYAFTTTTPQRVTLWDGDGRPIALTLAGPAGEMKPEGSLWHGKKFDQVVAPGRYVLTVSSRRTKETTASPTGRFEVRMVVRDPEAGEDGARCAAADFKPIEVGETVTGRMRSASCQFRIQQGEAPAELYGFTLAEPQDVVIEVDPAGFGPLVFVSSPSGGQVAEPKEGPGMRRLQLSLPAGDHKIFVFANKDRKTGTFRLSVK